MYSGLAYGAHQRFQERPEVKEILIEKIGKLFQSDVMGGKGPRDAPVPTRTQSISIQRAQNGQRQTKSYVQRIAGCT